MSAIGVVVSIKFGVVYYKPVERYREDMRGFVLYVVIGWTSISLSRAQLLIFFPTTYHFTIFSPSERLIVQIH